MYLVKDVIITFSQICACCVSSPHIRTLPTNTLTKFAITTVEIVIKVGVGLRPATGSSREMSALF